MPGKQVIIVTSIEQTEDLAKTSCWLKWTGSEMLGAAAQDQSWQESLPARYSPPGAEEDRGETVG